MKKTWSLLSRVRRTYARVICLALFCPERESLSILRDASQSASDASVAVNLYCLSVKTGRWCRPRPTTAPTSIVTNRIEEDILGQRGGEKSCSALVTQLKPLKPQYENCSGAMVPKSPEPLQAV